MHFLFLQFQEDNEIPSTLLTKDGMASTFQDEIGPSAPTPVTDLNCSQDEGLQTISLSSDDDEEKGATSPLAEGGDDSLDLHEDSFPGLGSEHLERSRADKFKRSSLKKVDSLKKGLLTKQHWEKINQIVPPEQREKIKKSFHPQPPPKELLFQSSSFRVSPIDLQRQEGTRWRCWILPAVWELTEEPEPVDVPNIGGPDGELPLAELHSSGEKTNGDDLRSPSTPGSGGLERCSSQMRENGPSVRSMKTVHLQLWLKKEVIKMMTLMVMMKREGGKKMRDLQKKHPCLRRRLQLLLSYLLRYSCVSTTSWLQPTSETLEA